MRNKNGYGALPGFEDFAVPDEGLAQGAVVNGYEVHVVELCDDTSAKETAAYWLGGGTDISAWQPQAPEGDGWTLSAVLESEEGPIAVFARPACTASSTARPTPPNSCSAR
jgi:hypothetical protein